MALTLQDGLREIKEGHIESLIEFLKTGVFKNRSNMTFMKVYGTIIELADKDENGKKLYDFYASTIQDYISNEVVPICQKLQGEDLLTETAKRWEQHKILVYWMQRVFQYLDRYHCPNNNLPTLFQCGLEIFLQKFFNALHTELKTAIFLLVEREREGETVDRSLLRTIANLFVQVGLTDVKIQKVKENDTEKLMWTGTQNRNIYTTLFEEPFVQESSAHYGRKSLQWLTSMSCAEYLRMVDTTIKLEEERATHYLDVATKPLLMAVIDQQLIAAHASQVVEMETGCAAMLQYSRIDELSLMFNIFYRVPSTLQFITQVVQPFIFGKGDAIIKNAELIKTPIPYVSELLKLKTEVDSIVRTAFQEHAAFQKARNKAFEEFLNHDTKNAHLLAVYCDFQLKKDLKGKSESETDSILDSIVRLFCHLHDRDVFVHYYKTFLSRRLLQHSSVSDEAEHLMIEKLKIECGYHLTSKLAGMFTDMRLSKEVHTEFKALQHKGRPNGLELELQVLTAGFWPEMRIVSCRPSAELTQACSAFDVFYKSMHSGRKLTFLFHLGSAELSTHCYAQPYTLIVSTYQAIILALFNNQEKMTTKEISAATEIPLKELKRHLLSLFAPKQRVLMKNPKTTECNDDDEFSIHSAFESRSRRVPITLLKGSDEDADDAAPKPPDERCHVLDAAIVRIMKSRKTLKHNELVEEVFRQMTMFRPQPIMIKSRIESLIEREYLKRDDRERNVYIYLP
eukprot:GILK01002963.1.p1 GENE.GILK01002963.1~~GILK01002963.1.p1  ORF type:complete len:756 (-),score=135.64 GILK01002963.1:180-2396(-)